MKPLLAALDRGDQRALLALCSRRTTATDLLVVWLTHLGGATFSVSLCVALAAGIVPQLAHAGRTALVALILSHVVVQALKRIVVRPRPRLPAGPQALTAFPDRFSFPSGHAAAAGSVGLSLALSTGGPLGVGILGLAAAVGLSRCYLGVHYPGDVLAGWLLAAWGVWVAGPALALAG